MQEHFTRLFSRETYLQDECVDVVVETDTAQTALLRALTTIIMSVI